MTRQATFGIWTAGILVVAVLGYVIYQTKSQQTATQQQLDAMKGEIAASRMPGTGTPAPVVANNGPALPMASAPDGSVMAKEKLMQDYLDEGYRLLNAQNPESAKRAIAIFREALAKVDAKNVHYLNGLARAQLMAGDMESSAETFERGRAVDPKRAELASGLGWAHWNLKRYAQAKSDWEEAVVLDPLSEDAWRVLSWIYMATGDFEKSRQGFVTLLKIDPSRKEWITGLTMARASNHNLDQIRAQFKGMPEPAAFKAPVPRPSGV